MNVDPSAVLFGEQRTTVESKGDRRRDARTVHIALGQPSGRLGDAPLEIIEVEPVDQEGVAGIRAREAFSTQRSPEPADKHADLLAGARRRLVAPQHLHQLVDAYRSVASEGERLDQGACLAAADLSLGPALDLQAPQEPHSQVTHRGRLGPSVRAEPR